MIKAYVVSVVMVKKVEGANDIILFSGEVSATSSHEAFGFFYDHSIKKEMINGYELFMENILEISDK